MHPGLGDVVADARPEPNASQATEARFLMCPPLHYAVSYSINPWMNPESWKIAQLKARLEESEKKLLDFAQAQQIVEVNEKSSIAENNLESANAALGQLISERTKNEELWRQAEKTDAINLPQLLSNSVIDSLRGKRKELSIEYQQKLETFKPEYPAMVQIKKPDRRDRPATCSRGSDHQGFAQGGL
jgi:hypothetical protein